MDPRRGVIRNRERAQIRGKTVEAGTYGPIPDAGGGTPLVEFQLGEREGSPGKRRDSERIVIVEVKRREGGPGNGIEGVSAGKRGNSGASDHRSQSGGE